MDLHLLIMVMLCSVCLIAALSLFVMGCLVRTLCDELQQEADRRSQDDELQGDLAPAGDIPADDSVLNHSL